jgi:phosphoglycerate dehydrogenase-like enzyme
MLTQRAQRDKEDIDSVILCFFGISAVFALPFAPPLRFDERSRGMLNVPPPEEHALAKTRIGVVIPTPLQEQLFSPADRERFERLGEVRWHAGEKPPTDAKAVAHLQSCAIGVGSWRTPHPASPGLVAGCPDLRLWVHAAGTVKHMFGPHLDGRDLAIATCAPAIAEGVAEITMACLIVGLKKLIPNAEANRRGRAPKPANSRSLMMSTIGIVGASQVGRRTIRNLRPHGCRILLFDPYVTAAEAREMGVEKVDDLLDLCHRSHAVALHTPALPATRHIMGAAQFRAMPDDAVFVNNSRGECVDEPAMVAELSKGRLFAFIDVSTPEPTPDDGPLRKLPNVMYTSHIAGGVDWKIGRQVVDDVEAFLNGRQPTMVVTKDMLERMA